MSGLELPSMVF